jgi:superoxide reductase
MDYMNMIATVACALLFLSSVIAQPEVGGLYQTADWKSEKHVPVIELQNKPISGKTIEVKVTVGKEIPHPNTAEHHIEWIDVYFLPDGESFPYELGRSEFSAHGASTQGANASGVYSQPSVALYFTTTKPGTIYASSYCNIHGLWSSSLHIAF